MKTRGIDSLCTKQVYLERTQRFERMDVCAEIRKYGLRELYNCQGMPHLAYYSRIGAETKV